MKIITLTFILMCLFHVCYAQNFHMVKDINDSKDGSPANYNYPTHGGQISKYAVLNNVAYFAANDGIHGSELWRSDGTTVGTYMVKDIRNGYSGSAPSYIVTSGSYIYFAANDSVHGAELWKSNGTESGTSIVSDISPGIASSSPNYLIDVNGTLFFSANSDKGNELMKSDGTASGTVVIRDITQGLNNNSLAFYLAASANNIFFFYSSSIDSLNGEWVSDGTDAGTKQMVKSFPAQNITAYATVGNKFFFVNGDDYQLWVSDGTTTGTHQVKNLNGGADPNFYDFAGMNEVLYFTATDVSTGRELWRSDGTDTGTYVVKDIMTGSDKSSSPYDKTVVNGKLFFLAFNDIGNADLWKSDGSEAGTVLVKSFGSENLPGPDYITDINNQAFLSSYTVTNGFEPWKSDGTTAGTILIKDIFQGIYSSSSSNFTDLNGNALFMSNDGSTGAELWISDGTSQGTHLVKDINQTISSDSYPNWSITPFNNKIYFRAYTPKYGNELWATDGTDANTTRITDIQLGSLTGVHTTISNFFTSSNKIYLEGITLDYGNELWASDGINSNLVKDITAGRTGTTFPSIYYEGLISEYCNIDTTAFFVSGSFNNTIWKTDGTPNGTVLLKQAIWETGLTVLKNQVFFTIYPNQLWKTDGTMSGTIQINTASPNAEYLYIPSILAYNNFIYFQSSDNKMWQTDGSETGTVLFKNINPLFHDPYDFVNSTSIIINNTLIFAANDGTSGFELWKTDGTPTGTALVKDIFSGSGSSISSFPTGNFTKVNNELYFIANDNIHGAELWKSDGTEAGTMMVKDITPGSNSTSIRSLTAVGNQVAFLIYDIVKENGVIWQSDGTDAGTHPVNDTNLSQVTITDYFNNAFVGYNNQLYFAGSTPTYGVELWTGTLEGSLPLSLLNFTGKLVYKDAQLNWTTTNEQNFGYFNLQRSIDGIHFSTISKIYAKGTITNKTDYQYIDNDITALNFANIYYRLEQVDKDGKTELSKIVKIYVGNNPVILLHPNPFKNNLQVIIDSKINQTALLSITDNSGRVIVNQTATISEGKNVINFNSSAWSNGTYFIRILFDNNTKTVIKAIKE